MYLFPHFNAECSGILRSHTTVKIPNWELTEEEVLKCPVLCPLIQEASGWAPERSYNPQAETDRGPSTPHPRTLKELTFLSKQLFPQLWSQDDRQNTNRGKPTLGIKIHLVCAHTCTRIPCRPSASLFQKIMLATVPVVLSNNLKLMN